MDEAVKSIFFQNMDVGDKDTCWEWRGKVNSWGYGVIYTRRKGWKAHRISYEIYNGGIPSKVFILHDCGNSLCINPHHLYIGDHKQNMKDMVRHGNSTRGEKHPMAKLTELQVQEIRMLAHLGEMSYNDIAKRFGIKLGGVSNIVYNKTWKWLPKTDELVELENG